MDDRRYVPGRAGLPVPATSVPVTAPLWQALVCSDGSRCDDCRESDRQAAWQRYRQWQAAWQHYYRQQQAAAWHVQDPLVRRLHVDLAREVGGVPVVTAADARHSALIQAVGLTGLVCGLPCMAMIVLGAVMAIL